MSNEKRDGWRIVNEPHPGDIVRTATFFLPHEESGCVAVVQADRNAGQALLEQLHAIMRAQGAEVADTIVKDDGCIVQALARHRIAHSASSPNPPEVVQDAG